MPRFANDSQDKSCEPFTILDKDQLKTDEQSQSRVVKHKKDPARRSCMNTYNPTTSFLTATTLIYAIGAGITAAAGTRLALQLFLARDFYFPLIPITILMPWFLTPQHQVHCFVISFRCLIVLTLGNLRACCLPWKWWPFLRPPLRYQTLIPRYPSKPW